MRFVHAGVDVVELAAATLKKHGTRYYSWRVLRHRWRELLDHVVGHLWLDIEAGTCTAESPEFVRDCRVSVLRGLRRLRTLERETFAARERKVVSYFQEYPDGTRMLDRLSLIEGGGPPLSADTLSDNLSLAAARVALLVVNCGSSLPVAIAEVVPADAPRGTATRILDELLSLLGERVGALTKLPQQKRDSLSVLVWRARRKAEPAYQAKHRRWSREAMKAKRLRDRR